MITTISKIVFADVNLQTWLLIADNDISQSLLSSTGNLKVFELGIDSLTFKGLIDSRSFGLKQLQPINDFSIIGDKQMILATIGNTGVGYASLSDKQGEMLVNVNVVDMKEIGDVHGYLLDNSVFQQVGIVQSTSSQLTLLITSSTSIPMIIEFKV